MVSQLGLDFTSKQMDLPSPQAPTAKAERGADSGAIDLSAKSDESERDFSRSLQKMARDKTSIRKSDAKRLNPERTPAPDATPNTPFVRPDIPQAATPNPVSKTREMEDIEDNGDDGSVAGLSPRQSVIAKFMKKMEDEVGVRPEKIVQAMATLTPEELMRAPEETMNLVLNQLEIPMKARPKAEELYGRMLDESAAATVEELKQRPDQTVALEVLNPEQLQQRELNASVDRLNQKFVSNQAPTNKGQTTVGMTSPMAQSNQVSPKAAPAASEADEFSLRGDALGETAEDSNAAFTTLSGLPTAEVSSTPAVKAPIGTSPTANMASVKPESPEVGKSLANATEQTSKSLTPDDFFSNQAPSTTAQTLPSTAVANPAGLASPTPVPQAALANSTQNAEMAAASVASGPAATFDRREAGSESGSSSDKDASGDQANTKIETKMNDKLDPKAMAQMDAAPAQQAKPAAASIVPRLEVTKADHAKNIQELMARSQILVRQGGGEMKVQLNPEGLGQVNLRVSVQDGQVNIQMVTENQEAKRTIESSLGELKTHLASNRLHLDAVKVDVATNTNPDFKHNGQNQQDNAQDMARDFARGFLGNFREERQADREAMMGDLGRLRSYGSDSGRKTIEGPDTSTKRTQATSRSRNGRLNVVA